jgi:hypothetical protein
MHASKPRYTGIFEIPMEGSIFKIHKNFVDKLTTKNYNFAALLSTDCYPDENLRGKPMENSGK